MSEKEIKILLAGLLGHKIEYQMTNPPRPFGVHFKKNAENGDYSKGVLFTEWTLSLDERNQVFNTISSIREFLNK